MDKSTLAISHGFKLMVLSAFVDDTLNKEIISETVSALLLLGKDIHFLVWHAKAF